MYSARSFVAPSDGFDIIGDVHGCAKTLVELLSRLGYERTDTSFAHAKRKVIFVGDIVDRGPYIRASLKIVKSMVDDGQAICLLGNHELNAVAHSTYALHEDADPRFLRKAGNISHAFDVQTLTQFEQYQEEWQSYVEWFKTLPLFLDFDDFRVVHACWDEDAVQHIRHKSGEDETLLDNVLPFLVNGDRQLTRSVDRVTRGTNLRYPDGRYLLSGDGVKRSVFRTKFWADSPKTYRDVVYQPDALPKDLENRALDSSEIARLSFYEESEKPLFFGHYWLGGRPSVQRKNIVCLDYSAVKYGRLVSYRFDGESKLDDEKFVWVYVDPKSEFEF